MRAQGEKSLGPIKKKLGGHIQEKGIDKLMTVPNQVDWLIKQATSSNNLVRTSPSCSAACRQSFVSWLIAVGQALMYQGWAPWL